MTRPALDDERDAALACCGEIPRRGGAGRAAAGAAATAASPAAPTAAPAQAPVAMVLAVLVTAVVVAVVNNSMVTVLLPQMRQDLGASAAAAGWVVTGFSLTFAIGAAFYGRASDMFGIRAVFCAGVAVFIAGSLLATWDAGLPGLLVGRLVQGAGAAAIPSLASVTVAKVLPAGRRGFAFGLIGTGLGAGQALGPVLGGVIAELAGWRSLFLGTAVLSAVVLVGASRTLPGGAGADRGGWRRLDLLGGCLLSGAFGLALLAVTMGQAHGFVAVTSWGSLLVAVALAVAFTARIRSAPSPFAPPALFGNRAFRRAAGVGFVTQFAYLGSIVLVPQLASTVNGLSTGQVGLVLLPGALAVAVLSPLVGSASDRVGSRPPVTAGLGVLAAAVLSLSTLAGSSAFTIGATMLGMGVGLALVTSPLVNAASAALPDGYSGIGLGLYQSAFIFGGGSGAAVLGAVLSARDAALTAWNPLHSGPGAAFSDTLLVVAAVLLVALLAARRLPSRPRRAAELGR